MPFIWRMTMNNENEIAKYAKCINEVCKGFDIKTFWWDTSFLVDRKNLSCLQTVVDSIMDCWNDSTYEKSVKEKNIFVEESAKDAIKKIRTGWNLGNTLDAHKYKASFDSEKNIWTEQLNASGLETETIWHQPHTTSEMICYIKKLGFNAVRLPVTWVGHLDENNKIDSQWMARVKEIVDMIMDQNLYCILNVHHDGGEKGWVRACESSFNQFSKRLVSIYEQICKTFADYDERLLFEGVNEMLDENASWADPTENASIWINKWNQIFVDTVRKSGGNNIARNLVVMAGAGKETVPALQKFKMPKDCVDNHLIFEFHNYDPQRFCWPQNPAGTLKDETAIWDSKFEDEIKNKFSQLMSEAKKFNVPMILGEYGAWPKEIR